MPPPPGSLSGFLLDLSIPGGVLTGEKHCACLEGEKYVSFHSMSSGPARPAQHWVYWGGTDHLLCRDLGTHRGFPSQLWLEADFPGTNPTSRVNLGKSLHLAKPHVPHLSNGDIIVAALSVWLLRGQERTLVLSVECGTKLAHSKCSINTTSPVLPDLHCYGAKD